MLLYLAAIAGTMKIASTASRQIRAIDSHLHVWSNGEAPFPFADGKEPPASLRHCSSAENLLDSMTTAGMSRLLCIRDIVSQTIQFAM
jgi:predicted TIM-barrel fold metal-dependent hydrolase